MYGLYNDDVKRTCSPITDTMCVKYKKKKNYCCFGLVKAVLLQLGSPFFRELVPSCLSFPTRLISLELEFYNSRYS